MHQTIFMKKLLTLSVAIFCTIVMCYAEVIKLQATSFAFKSQNDYGYWSDWSDWEDSSCLIVINADNDRINIYSKVPQEYDIYDYEGESSDNKGGTQFTFKCIDEDGLRCTIRFRVQSDGGRQLYVDYADMMWVYNVVNK